MDYKVQAVHFTADPKLLDFVKWKVEKLTHFHDRIVGAEVFLKVDKKESHSNKVAEIRMNIPGKELFASKQCDSFEAAADEAVEALRKQLRKHKDKLGVKS